MADSLAEMRLVVTLALVSELYSSKVENASHRLEAELLESDLQKVAVRFNCL